MKTLFAVLVTAFGAGCATQPLDNHQQGLAHLANNNLEAAYRFLECPARDREAEVEQIIRSNPKLIEAAVTTFSEEALSNASEKHGRKTAHHIESLRLQCFKRFASEQQYSTAAANLEKVFPGEVAAQAAEDKERAMVATMPVEEQGKYWDEKRRKEREANTLTGIVLNVQVTNESRLGNAAGANLGAALGQASYLDSTSWRGYSATSQLGAGLAGALLGSMLDQPTRIQYRLSYFIKLANGDVRQVDILSTSQTHIPPGICVDYHPPSTIDIANQNKCDKQ